jgi:hypothetical protein
MSALVREHLETKPAPPRERFDKPVRIRFDKLLLVRERFNGHGTVEVNPVRERFDKPEREQFNGDDQPERERFNGDDQAALAPRLLTALDLMDDANLLQPWFSGSSWDCWRTVLKAAHGLPLNKRELPLFHEIAGDRKPPRHRVRELIAIVGRRGGKDSIASAIADAAAVNDYSAMLRPGEKASVLCLACDRTQAKVVLNYIRGHLHEVPMLHDLVASERADGFDLANNVEVVVSTNDFRSVRGRSVVCAILDEAAYYAGDDAPSSDIEVYNALTPGLATLPGSMMVIISSPYKKSGLLYDKWRQHYARDSDDILVVRGPSRTFNPTLPQSIIDDALLRDRDAANAEWLAEWRQDISGFIERALIEALVEHGTPVRPPDASIWYHGFVDSSGGVHDSYTCAIAHREADVVVLDCLYERQAPFDPHEVTAEIAALVKSYHLTEISGDKYAAGWTAQAFEKHGIRYTASPRVRSEIYLCALPLFASGRVRLIDNPRMVHQFAALERRTFRTGRDVIDHGPLGRDDCANAAAGALVLAGDDNDLNVWIKLGQ